MQPSPPSYDVSFDAAAGLVRYRIAGFWDVATARGFIDALRGEIGRRAKRGAPPRVLGDATGFAVQGGDVTQLIEGAMMYDIVPAIDRLALVVAAVLNKLQVERGAVTAKVNVFLTEADALRWLQEPRA